MTPATPSLTSTASQARRGPLARAITQTATASVGGSPALRSHSPRTTALPGAAAQARQAVTRSQTGTVATAVTAPVVKVRRPIRQRSPAFIVTLRQTAGGHTRAAEARATRAGSPAPAVGRRVLVGTNTATTTSGTLPAVTFTATSLAGPPARSRPHRAPRAHPGQRHDRSGRAGGYPKRTVRQPRAAGKDVVSLRLGATRSRGQAPGDRRCRGGQPAWRLSPICRRLRGIGYTIVSTSGSLDESRGKPFDIAA